MTPLLKLKEKLNSVDNMPHEMLDTYTSIQITNIAIKNQNLHSSYVDSKPFLCQGSQDHSSQSENQLMVL